MGQPPACGGLSNPPPYMARTRAHLRCINLVMRYLKCALILYATAAVAANDKVTLDCKWTPRDLVQARITSAPAANPEREAKLKDMLRDAGCPAGQLQLQPVKGVNLPNVICTVPGETDSTILIGAHFDHVKHGLGIIDNWSGASLLPSLLESITSATRRHTFVLIGFTEEERGLIGSYFYAAQLSRQDLQKIAGMINLDSLGAGPSEVDNGVSDPSLVQLFIDVAGSVNLPFTFVDMIEYGTSDYKPFRERNVPALAIHSITQQNLKLLHSTHDNMEAIRMDDYYQTYRLLAVYLSYLDALLYVKPRPETTPHRPPLRQSTDR